MSLCHQVKDSLRRNIICHPVFVVVMLRVYRLLSGANQAEKISHANKHGLCKDQRTLITRNLKTGLRERVGPTASL